MPRKILHLDLDAFFCAVEEQRDPALRGKPFAVGGRPEGRGVVASCSYPARAFGVHSAMPMAQAVRLCPDLIIIPPHREAYLRASREVMARVRELTPLVEQISIDEAFLDVSDLPEPLEIIARGLQSRIREELGLPCSLGGATNKLTAKIANDVGKSRAGKGGYPNAITIAPPGEEAAFLAPLPVRALWGVGPKSEEKLHALGIFTIGQLAAYPQQALGRLFGQHGWELARRARGIDNRPVISERGRAKSISKETTFARDVSDAQKLRRTLEKLAAGVARSLRRKKLLARTVKLKLRFSDFTTLTRQTTLAAPTNAEATIIATAADLFDRLWRPSQPVRLIGVGVSNLQEGLVQLALWDEQDDQIRRLQEAVDALQARFGPNAIHRGFHAAEGDGAEA
ncbi:MAG TPA: DNA polymerase IV [Anaerolineae bacterium]|nr:DNA polymerase IV [Caldilineae bacterium]HID34680.1 DNA polymerase IV [Anaerolineae bacterium]HIQ11298.1 DNA polymerase IV [Caldilineales bacterium]